MTGYGPTREDRTKGAAGAAVLVALIGYGLIAGLGVDFPQRIVEDLKVVALLPDSPPPKPDPVRAPKQAEKRKEGAASPPNIKSKATEIVAPRVPVVIPRPQPVVVAPVFGLGSDRSAGAAPVVGPGTGSGGQGDGLGSGDGGDGDGGGGGTSARLVSKRLEYRKLPRAFIEANVSGLVHMEFVVGVKGRVTDCRITRSSGDRVLDLVTCDMAKQYLRYRPGRDAAGRLEPQVFDAEQRWDATPDERDRYEDGGSDDR